MMIFNNKKTVDLLSHLSNRLNQIGIFLQSNIARQFKLTDMASYVHVNILKQRIYLRFKLSINSMELFDNDIVNIRLTNDKIHVTCFVYSNYGMDKVMEYQDNIDNFESTIVDNISLKLLSCIKSHINFIT
ncbi:hypothetical protein [Gilliamella sp. ESL0250]|uniref:hypothetical protein n=1 Tax=Gilliamella sp. ESL0250 TaxID=2705036 RepID=UPI001580929F|nr:hypothetical protein [Gilliamella sp. ESL0250]NUF50409.1 hypothetical protein [Gilliamella sp. ESL0250]